MRENRISRIWEWIRDRKTNTLLKWRSTVVRTSRDEDDTEKQKLFERQPRSHSAVSLPSSSRAPPPEYENFFEEPVLKNVLEVRRISSSIRKKSSDEYPVSAPDLESPSGWLDRSSTPKTTPRPDRRSPKQIRFLIPEVRVSFEEEEPHRVEFDDRRSPLPPAEIEWFPATLTPTSGFSSGQSSGASSPFLPSPSGSSSMNGSAETVRIPSPASSNSIRFDVDDVSPCTRRHSASEKARQNLIAQRRQSNVQLVNSITGRRTSTTLIPLTQAQIHLVRSLWRQIYMTKGPTVIGTSIYHRLCFKCPMVKEQLRRVPLPPKFPNHDSFVKAHSKAMAELIDQVVENLDTLDIMTDELMRIGRLHARTLRGELTGKLWNIVAETVIDCTLEWGDRRCRSETVRKAWALIVAFMIDKIKGGHHEQRKLMLASRQSMPSIEVRMNSLQI